MLRPRWNLAGMTTTASSVTPRGLSIAEAASRLRADGPNALAEAPLPTVVRRIARSLRDPLVLVLLTALVLTLSVKDLADAAVIALVVVVNSAIGLRQDIKADRTVHALARLAATGAWVIRSGQPREVPVSEIVTGDLLMLRHGDLVPADGLLVEGAGVQVDESMLTGESVPVDRVAAEEPGPDRMPRVAPDSGGPLASPPTRPG